MDIERTNDSKLSNFNTGINCLWIYILNGKTLSLSRPRRRMTFSGNSNQWSGMLLCVCSTPTIVYPSFFLSFYLECIASVRSSQEPLQCCTTIQHSQRHETCLNSGSSTTFLLFYFTHEEWLCLKDFTSSCKATQIIRDSVNECSNYNYALFPKTIVVLEISDRFNRVLGDHRFRYQHY